MADKAPGSIYLRNREARSRYYSRLSEHHRGRSFPDARTQEMRDQGEELIWKAAVRRNEIRKGYRAVLLDAALSAESELRGELPIFLRPQAG